MLAIEPNASNQYRKNQHKTSEKYFRCHGRIWRVNNQHRGIYTRMFSVIVEQLLAMLSYDSKVLVARFDLHQDVATNSSKHVSECIKQLKKQLFASHSLKFVGYAWCREEGDGVRQHYHLALFLEGHKMKTTYKLEEALCAIWKSVGGTHMHRARFHNIHRDDPEAIAEALFHLSYLAKCKGKATISPNFKAFSASRLTIKASLS